MRCLPLLFLLAGCATGDWSNYSYGPGDWLAEKTGWDLGDSMYDYEWLEAPQITVIRTEDLTPCGKALTQGCALMSTDRASCMIYVGSRASQAVVEHEKRHCRGWRHPEGQNNMWSPKPNL